MHFVRTLLILSYLGLSGLVLSGYGQVTITYLNGDNDATNYDTSAPNDPTTLSIASGAATQSGVLSGTGAVIKAGSGDLTFSGANTYSGTTTVSAGRLIITNGNVNALANSAVTVDTGATLLLDDTSGGGSYSLGSLAGAGRLNVRSGVAFIGGDNSSTTFSGAVINGGAGGNLIKQGTGTLTLTGSGYRIGEFDINAGAVVMDGVSGTISASIDVIGSALTIRNTTSALNLSAINNSISGGTVLITGASTVVEPSFNISNFDQFTIEDGASLTTLQLRQGNAGTMIVDEASLTFGEFTSIANQRRGTIAISDASGGTALTMGNATNSTFEGVIEDHTTGSGSVRKTGSGTITFEGANTYSGSTTIEQGTLQIGNSLALQNTTVSIDVNDGLDVNGVDATLGGLSGSGNLDLGTTTLTIGNNDEDTSYSGVISGTGSLTKSGTGASTLTGNSTYSGGTTISGGTLLANNTIGSATGTGAVTVANGGTLGGTGFIGGEVTIQDGGTLAAGTSPGTLTINNNLILNNASILNYELDTPGVVGGGVNDLTVVNGNLTLDGILNVTDLGNFGAGTYRLFDYTGALTDNGLLFGTTPGGFELVVDTATGSQINLSVTATTRQFWDDSDTTADGGIDGGNGTWDSTTTNWTSSTGNANSSWVDGLDAVFTTTGGTVTIADGFTADIGGLDFQADGYTIQADSGGAGTGQLQITGTTNANVAAGLTAEVSAVISGTGGLTKTGGGTLTLSGTNTYSGGTAIDGGRIRINADSNLGDASGNLSLDGGVLGIFGDVTTARATTLDAGGGTFLVNPATTLTHTGTISGSGALTKSGNGTLILSGDSTYSGGTTVSAGTLQIGNGGTTGSIVGDVTNNGVLSFNRSDALTFAGVISGTGSVTNDGTGILTLSGNNTYSGGTAINAGRIRINADNNLGDAGGTLSLDAGELGVFGDVTTARATTLGAGGGTFLINPTNTLTHSGTISGAGALTKTGNGTLTLSGNNTYTGDTNASAGTLEVTGTTGTTTGSIFTTNGSVNVNSGGTFTTVSTFIADAAGTTSTITVDGAGSSLTTTGQLFIGDDGNGTLNITDGGLVTAGGNSFVGRAAGSVGNVTVNNSTFNTTSQLFLGGDLGTGTMNVLNGSSVTNAQTRIATNAGSMGTLLVDASTFNAGTLTVSQSGTALMTVQNGSTLTTSTSADFVGQVGMGTLIVDDSMATFGGDLFVGNNTGSNGILTVRNGATVNVTGQTFLGAGAGAAGTVTVDNATWNNTDRIFIGSQGSGTLNILNGATVTSGGLNPFVGATGGATGTLLVDGTGTTYTVNNTGDFAMRGDNSSITVSGGAQLSTQGRVFLLADNGTTNNVTVTGANSTWTTANEVSLGHTGTDVVMTLAEGGTLSIGGSETLFVNDGPTGGTLNIGNGAGAGILDVANVTGGFTGGGQAVLNFNHSDANYGLTRDGTVGGTDVILGGNLQVNHNGSGTTTLNGTHTHTGATNINAGTLLVNGGITNSAVVVNGGTLGGIGNIVGNVTVNAGGTLSPGTSPGTLTVGSLTLNAGSTTQFEINGTTAGTEYDQIVVTGNAQLGGTANLTFGFTPSNGDTFTLIDAATITGDFDSVVNSLGNALVFTTSITDDYILTITAVQTSFATTGFTGDDPELIAIAMVLDDNFSDPDFLPIINALNGLPGTSIEDALEQINPDELAALSGFTFANTRNAIMRLGNRLRAIRHGAGGGIDTSGFSLFDQSGQFRSKSLLADTAAVAPIGLQLMEPAVYSDPRFGIFVSGSGTFGDYDGDQNGAGYDYDAASVLIGADYRITDTAAVGIYGGYDRTDANLGNNGGQAGADTARFGVTGTWWMPQELSSKHELDGMVYAEANAGGAHHWYETDRNGFGGVASGDTTATELSAGGALGYEFKKGNLRFGPEVSLNYTHLWTDGFTETGSIAPLTIANRTRDSLYSTVGGRASYTWELESITLSPYVHAGWRHEYFSTQGATTARFAAGAGSAFTVNGSSQARDSIVAGAGINAILNDWLSAELSYFGEGSVDTEIHSINGSVTARF